MTFNFTQNIFSINKFLSQQCCNYYVCFFTFAPMKRKFAIFNLALMTVVLLATAWQSFHAFSHSHFTATAHQHIHKKEAKYFGMDNHDHEDEHCSVCDFHFDYFVAPQEFCLTLDFPFQPIAYRFSSIEGSWAFAGSLFSHRGPPSFV